MKNKPEKEIVDSVRELKGGSKYILNGLAIILSLFVLAASSFLNLQTFHQNSIFLLLIVLLGFLLYPLNKKGIDKHHPSIIDIGFIILALLGIGYIILNYNTLHVDRASHANTTDYIFAVIAIIVLFEITRRTIGIFIPLLSIFAIIYALYGNYFPIDFAHSGFSLNRLLYRFYMTTEGIFGSTLSIAATYIMLFILFGAFLGVSGASKLFNDLALAIAGQRRGGPAQVAVISSALTGSLNGSAVANVATTGSFTIPLMKNIGLTPRFAGGVEAAASTGGMIMPPIMGAAAFIMAGFLGVPYTTIVLAGIIPAVFYYIALIWAIDTEAKKKGLKGVSKENIPLVRKVLKERGALLLPIIVVIVALLIGKTAIFAGFAGIISSIIASYCTTDKTNRVTPKSFLEALIDGAKGSIQVALACASVGIVIATVGMTGVGSMLAYNVIDIAGGHLIVILIMVMVTCIVLSFGLPSTALYIVVAVTVAPSLVQAGVEPLAAHFFVFYFGAMSNVTPPVALAAYTGAGIAKADPVKTSWTALRLALPGFIIPFLLVYHPELLLNDATTGGLNYGQLIVTILISLVGIYALVTGMGNYLFTKLNILERILFIVFAVMLIFPEIITSIVGIIGVILLMSVHYIKFRKVGVT
ncbi:MULTISPECIES: TRAP transporter permease [Mammaliicoccus]|jgi:TRAP transporter 4TM/12TM fusion protein|uniref:TRAP transporter permease n=1 Tax=Mammaliicoccus lentus TaxID=42858 RepID=A0ABS6GWR0_MAMLE|nr:TRAP transporter permease [Mammaliicoccus lentus]MBF0794944.1 TRAP transporter permease [Mammaliicoccus lentus]MBF0840805.1 TRAP transporter permease [Mammaliicoccus lentus]MBU6113864.1 TRAP transporter permease [Mammaliicoccus lentus]MCD2477597.1 TRAP transporter permease [Mammaliicoccus lentus]MCD2521056.1 TRAP transporter permease [Mammaliicoccus lentus]